MGCIKGSSDTSWEYQELIIPREIRVEGTNYPTPRQLAEFHGYEGVVPKYLGLAAQDDWLPDESADWDSLIAAGRFTISMEPSTEESGTAVTIYTSVIIRLKRLARLT